MRKVGVFIVVERAVVALRPWSAAIVFAFMLMCFPLATTAAQDRPTLDLLEVLDTVQSENPDIRRAAIERARAQSGYESARAGIGPQVDLEIDPYGIREARREIGTGPPATSVTTRTQSTGGTLRFSQQLPTGGRISTEGTLEASASTQLGDDGDENADTVWAAEPSVGLRFSQPVFVDGRVVDTRIARALDREAKAGVRNAEIAREDAVNGSLLAAVELYFTIADVRRSVDTLELSREILSRRIEETEGDVDAGVTSEQRLLQVRLQRNRTRETLLDIRDRLSGFERSFARLVAGEFDPREFSFERAADLDTDMLSQARELLDRYDGDTREAWDVSENSGVRRARVAVEQARDQAITSAPDRAAEFTVTGNVSRRYPDERDDETDVASVFPDLVDEDGGFDWSVSLGVTIPLYDGGRRRNQALADSQSIELAVLEHEEAKKEARDNLSDALDRLEILVERVEILRADRDFEADTLADTRALAEIGEATAIEVDEVRRDLRESGNAVGEAFTDMLLTILDIERVVGKPVMTEVTTRFVDDNE